MVRLLIKISHVVVAVLLIENCILEPVFGQIRKCDTASIIVEIPGGAPETPLRINGSGCPLLAVSGVYNLPDVNNPSQLVEVPFLRYFQGAFFQGSLADGELIPFPSFDRINNRVYEITDLQVKAAVFADGSLWGDDKTLRHELDRRAFTALSYLEVVADAIEKMSALDIENMLLQYPGRSIGEVPPRFRTAAGEKAPYYYQGLRSLLLDAQGEGSPTLHHDYLFRIRTARINVLDYLEISRNKPWLGFSRLFSDR